MNFNIAQLRPFTEKSMKKAIWQIATSILPFITLWTVAFQLWNTNKTVSVATMMLNAFFLVRIFIIQHDCGHHSYFDLKKHGEWNERVGWFCSLFHTLPYSYWATVHHFHHNHNGKLDVW
jgi:acyl-lipid omega-6 desaturase (Delta-12 desaturase)